MAMVETALTQIDELRGILHRLEGKIDALANSLNRDQGSAVVSRAIARSYDPFL
jgi:hypothetical protein